MIEEGAYLVGMQIFTTLQQSLQIDGGEGKVECDGWREGAEDRGGEGEVECAYVVGMKMWTTPQQSLQIGGVNYQGSE